MWDCVTTGVTQDIPDSADELIDEMNEVQKEKNDKSKSVDGEGDGDGEAADFDDEENSMAEIYFQPKYQDWVDVNRGFGVRCALDILQAILDEEIYTELRSKEQLGYLVGCMRKNTGGIYGITFVIQTSAYDPRYCIEKILEFLDTFYHTRFTEELFDKYKAGLMAKKGWWL